MFCVLHDGSIVICGRKKKHELVERQKEGFFAHLLPITETVSVPSELRLHTYDNLGRFKGVYNLRDQPRHGQILELYNYDHYIGVSCLSCKEIQFYGSRKLCSNSHKCDNNLGPICNGPRITDIISANLKNNIQEEFRFCREGYAYLHLSYRTPADIEKPHAIHYCEGILFACDNDNGVISATDYNNGRGLWAKSCSDPHGLCTDPEGRHLFVAGGRNECVFVYDTKSGRQMDSLEMKHLGGVYGVGWCRKNSYLVVWYGVEQKKYGIHYYRIC